LWHGSHDIAPARAEDVYVLADLATHVSDRAAGQGLLVVYCAVEHQPVPEVALQARSVHPLAAPLDRVQHLDPGLDQVRDRLADGAVAVQRDKDTRLAAKGGHRACGLRTTRYGERACATQTLASRGSSTRVRIEVVGKSGQKRPSRSVKMSYHIHHRLGGQG